MNIPANLRFALRTTVRNPGLAAVIVLTLALGVGALTAIFSVVYGVLLSPLPYQEPEQLVRIRGYDARTGPDATAAISLVNFLDLRAEATTMESMAAYNEWRVTLTGPGGAERLEGAEVTSEFFRVLGVEPSVGRFFVPEDESASGSEPIVLEHDFWVRRYGADHGIVGQSIRLNDQNYTVVGVTSPTFEDPELGGLDHPVVWRVSPRTFDITQTSRSSRQYTGLGRLAPGVNLAQAQAEMDSLMSGLESEFPDAVADRRVRLVSLKEQMTESVRPMLIILNAAVFLVLLIACVNVANLLLSRGAARGQELAIRASMGATRGQLTRQLLMESALLGLLGGALGILLAWCATETFLALGANELPRGGRIAVNKPVLAFALGTSLMAGLLASLAPALQIPMTRLHSAFGGGSRTTAGGRGGFVLQVGLVAAQVALSVILLVGAGLLIRSLWELQSTDPGFDPSGVLAMELAPAEAYYPGPTEIEGLHRDLHDRLGALPGVQSVASVSILPMGNNYIGFGFQIEGRPPPSGSMPSASIRSATPGYFRTLGIPLVRGRGFAQSDRRDAAPVMVITESMARTYWPESNPIGERLMMRGQLWEIVGIAGDLRHSALSEAPDPAMYVPFAQSPSDWMNRNAALVLRSDAAPVTLSGAVRQAVEMVDPGIPIESLRPMTDVVGATTSSERFRTLLLTLFALLALVLGVIGIYGVISHGVMRRTGEIGIRMAMGASGTAVLMLIFRQVGGIALIGAVVGIAGAFLLVSLMETLVFGISPYDPLTFMLAPAVVLAFALLACLLPAKRAARIHPTEALRYE